MRSQLRLLRAVFGNPDLRRLGGAWLATCIGVWGGALALSVYAFDHGGAAAVGLIALLRTLPGALVAPLLAVLADRAPRNAMLVCAALRAAVMFGLAAVAGSGAPLGAVYALVILLALVSPAYAPALTAMIPQVARTPLELASANIVETTVDNLGFVVGSLLTGIVLAAASSGTALAGLGLAYALAIPPLLRVTAGEVQPAADDDEPLDEGSELVAGFRAIAAGAHLRELVLLITVVMVVDGALDVLVVIAALGFLGAGESGAGTLTAIWGVGAVLGGIGVMVLLSRGRMLLGIVAGAVAVGVCLTSFALATWVPVAAVALFGFGTGFTLIDVAANTLLQRITPGHVLGRVAGVVETLSVIGIAAGSFGAAMLSHLVGERAAVLVTAVLIPVVVLLRRRVYAQMNAGRPVDEHVYGLLRAHPIFAPLPVATVELLAHGAERVTLAAGEVVVRQGEVGDRFYLVAEGECRVFVDGGEVRTMSPGEGFGEIALLHEAPRTATVHAIDDAVLFSVDHRSFLTAVAGLSRSQRAADRLSAERLAWAAPAEGGSAERS
jgi:Cyclic nucleotide-binding domain/Major Facilitator Superfamily